MKGCLPFSQVEQQTPSARAARLFLPRTRCQSLSIAERIWWTSLAATEVAVVGIPFRRCVRAEWMAASVAMRSWVHRG